MISGFFKRLTAEEYFQEVEKNASSSPVQRTVKALVHSPPSPPCNNEFPSPSSNLSRRSSSSNVILSVEDEIKVLEEMDANVPPQEKADLSKKRKKMISNPSADIENVSNPNCVEGVKSENEESTNERNNKLTIRFKKKIRKSPNNKEQAKDSDSDDIDFNFVERDDDIAQKQEPAPSNIFCLMMSKQKSEKPLEESSSPLPTTVSETPKQIDSEEASVKKVSSDGSLEFLKDVPKTCNKLKRPRTRKNKVVEIDHSLDEAVPPSSPSEEMPRRISTRIKHKRVISHLKDLSSSSEEEEEIKKAPRKKVKRKGEGTPNVKDPSSNSLFTPTSTLDKKSKLASIFVRESPEVSAARKAFLQSTAPEGIERLREQEMSAEALGNDYFNDFSCVPHINYKMLNSGVVKSSNISLKDISYHNFKGSLPKKPKLSWLLSSTQTEDPIEEDDDDLSYSLPLSNKKVYYYTHSETALSRESLLNLMMREIKDTTYGTPWTLKYAPKCSTHILGNHNHILALKNWLNSFSIKSKSNFRDSDAESCSSLGEFGTNAVVLYGPHGCGKTSTVYALASELGLKVLEVNASSYRNGRQFMNMTHEATQSHRVSRGSEAHKGISTLFKVKKALNEQPSSKNDSLILVEDIDLFFEVGDEGFYQALSGVIGTSKRPIILTYSSNKSKVLSIPLPKIDQLFSYQFKKVSSETTAQYLSSIALKEGYPITLESLQKLVESLDGNIGQSLLYLEFFCLSSKKTTGSRISPPLSSDFDTCLKQVLDISSEKSKIKRKPNALNLVPPIKMTTTSTLSWSKVMYSKGACEATASKRSKGCKYSRKDVKKMEKLALNLENYSASCENEVHQDIFPVDDLRKDSVHQAGYQVLESLYKLPSKTPSFLHTDILPVIRSVARIEEERRNLNSKRRFLHYFHSQLELPVSSEDLSLLRSPFQSSLSS